jgi:hypothetical protein
MAQGFSKSDLLKFLDYLADKGLMKGAAIASRKAAANAFLGILKPEEAEDLSNLNLDEVALRFANLKGSQFKPDSMRVYKSRVSSSLEDFKTYRKNPLAFKPSASIAKNSTTQKNDKPGAKTKSQPTALTKEQFYVPSQEVSFPIPIRPNVIVQLVGIPNDLTKREATKIANVVVALAQDDGK